MKKLVIITVVALISIFNNVYSQCQNTINTQSTDWRNYPATSANDWDWTESGSIHPVYLSPHLSAPSMYIELPYFCTKPAGTGSCEGAHNVESYQFRGNSKEYQDINPEDGWELLLKDFGSPNPNTGSFTISFNDFLDVDAKLMVQDIKGRVVHQQFLSNNKNYFDIKTEGLSGGVYFVIIQQGDQKQTSKIIIQN